MCLLFFVTAYVRFYLEFRTALPADSDFVARWLREHGACHIRVKRSDRIFSPLSYGIFVPVILLPAQTDWSDERQLSYILLHEYMHIRYRDILVKLAAAAALCIHWFNPVVWIMYLLCNRDIELACDARVLWQSGTDARAEYARTLIYAAEKSRSPLCAGNHFSQNTMEERITAIMKTKKISVFALLLSAVIAVMIIVPFATSAKIPSPPSDSASGRTGREIAAFVTDFFADSLTLDIVEYVTDDDITRKNELIQELNLVEGNDLSDGLFLDGYCIYNPDSTAERCTVTDETIFTFIDWDCRFTGSDEPEPYTTTDFSVFQEYLKTYDPMPGMPFFFELENGVVRSVTEKPMA